jgi:flagellar hook-basal body complex protein FliE
MRVSLSVVISRRLLRTSDKVLHDVAISMGTASSRMMLVVETGCALSAYKALVNRLLLSIVSSVGVS